jgi:mannose-6-phosphate isomerase-like protein (cupin superfamily)
MEYVRSLSRDGSSERSEQGLFGEGTGATHCDARWISTPPGGGSPAGLHTHEFDQIFLVLSGTMSIEIAEDRMRAGPDTIVLFPAGVPHRNWNPGTEPTVHVAINAPLPAPGAPFAQPVDTRA